MQNTHKTNMPSKPLSGSLSPRYRLLKTAHILLAA